MESDKQDYQIVFMPSGRRGRARTGETILKAAQQMGVEIESICGGRLTCAKCKIRVEEGPFPKHGLRSSADHVSTPGEIEQRLLDQSNNSSSSMRLSCSACVQGDLLIFVPEESRAQKQVIRKAAGDHIIDVQPAIRQVYVEVEPAILGDHRGDWRRLQEALAAQWDLMDLEIDLQVLRRLQPVLRKESWVVTVILWQEQVVIDVIPGYYEGIYGLAVDIGSTTLAGYLCDLRTGELLATASLLNPQITYGEDLMSRVSFAMGQDGGLKKLNRAIIDALNELAASAAKQAGLRRRTIHDLVLVGNTTMTHIALGINPRELGGAPFALAVRESLNIKASEIGLRLHPGARAHVLPSQAGHVGADSVAAVLAEEPFNRDETTLLVDVGTNAEIVLGNRDWMFSASSPTGPAFEGAQITFGMRAAPGAIERVRIDRNTWEADFQVIGDERWASTWELAPNLPPERQPNHKASGICGSGIIEAVAEMMLCGIIRPDGRFAPELTNERIILQGRTSAFILASGDLTSTGKPILVTQDDVRNIQLAKAALYAGAKLLMDQAGITSIDRIVLAGAFGSYIDPRYAMILGMIPDCLLEAVSAVGNAAGDGARIALLNRNKRLEADKLAAWIVTIDTAINPRFQDEFVAALHIPHAGDPFPLLADQLGEPIPQSAPRESRSRRRRTRNVSSAT